MFRDLGKSIESSLALCRAQLLAAALHGAAYVRPLLGGSA